MPFNQLLAVSARRAEVSTVNDRFFMLAAFDHAGILEQTS